MDVFTKEKRSWVMSRIKGKNTRIEKLLEKEFRKNNIRFRKHPRMFGRPDFLINKKLAVFVDGCFWHKCPEHYSEPKSRKGFWIPKIKKNIIRDRKVTRKLRKDGYSVLRFWEHDVEKKPERVVNKIIRKLNSV